MKETVTKINIAISLTLSGIAGALMVLGFAVMFFKGISPFMLATLVSLMASIVAGMSDVAEVARALFHENWSVYSGRKWYVRQALTMYASFILMVFDCVVRSL